MTLSGETLAAIPDDAVQELLKPNMSTVWLGPDRHCVFYPIRNREQWNLVLMYVTPSFCPSVFLMAPTDLPSLWTGDLITSLKEFEHKLRHWRR